jgi:hypothetical protein
MSAAATHSGCVVLPSVCRGIQCYPRASALRWPHTTKAPQSKKAFRVKAYVEVGFLDQRVGQLFLQSRLAEQHFSSRVLQFTSAVCKRNNTDCTPGDHRGAVTSIRVASAFSARTLDNSTRNHVLQESSTQDVEQHACQLTTPQSGALTPVRTWRQDALTPLPGSRGLRGETTVPATSCLLDGCHVGKWSARDTYKYQAVVSEREDSGSTCVRYLAEDSDVPLAHFLLFR